MIDLLPHEQLTVSTYDEIAHIWSTKYHLQDFWAKEMQRFNELLPSGKILDAGCGGARDALGLIQYKYEYVGVDMSEALLKMARQELPQYKFYKQNIYKLEFKYRFDGFWCSAGLLHLSKNRVSEALKSIKKVMKPGAIGFISVIDGSGEGLELEEWDDGSRHYRYFCYYSKSEFADVLSKNGLKVIDYKYRKDSDRFRWHCFYVLV